MKKALRHWLVKLHRYSGLLLSLFIVMAGLTGSALAFNDELDAWLNPQFYHRASTGPHQPFEVLAAKIEHEYPHARLAFFSMEPGDNAPLQARLRARHPDDALPVDTVFIDPVTAAMVGERNTKAVSLAPQNLMPFLFRLHRYLLLDKTGAIISGCLGLLWLATLLIGFALAWPKHRSGWRKALSIKRGAGGFRLMYDLHRSVGMVAGVLLVVTAFTGAVMNLPDVARPMVASLSSLTKPPKSSMHEGKPQIDWQQALEAAQASVPLSTPVRIARDDKQRLYQVRLRKQNDIQDSGSVRVFVDAVDGKVLNALDPLKGSAGDTFIGVQYGLHTGQLLGLPGKILIAFLGLLPLLFTITGIAIWLKKRKSETIVRARHLHQV
ncbi:putative iron-regulated membrane protein; Iron-uptake factor PiuB [Collimonas arenae]|uniref:Putative iron-regulated membrane protein Iron-uptake factor PiuB n=1 Tax=Collimonas arenae TaxID=279058 RepID=A0A0A1F4Y9_9BURK|nr:PepSY-associated TM helix domain-containing protein [Collimonas arenae]AIY39621.1 putative iron-regulated membrane protein; Iron-uptake factor PiuB [Collimonas arenae]